MGRTVASFRQVIKNEYDSLDKFKRALRKTDREIFEQMLYKARLHTQAGAYATLLDPMHAIIFGMLLELEKKERGKNERLPD